MNVIAGFVFVALKNSFYRNLRKSFIIEHCKILSPHIFQN